MKTVQQYLDGLKARVREVTPKQAHEAMSQDPMAVLIDIREGSEIEQGSPAQALRISKGMLEMQIGDRVPHADTPIYLLCASGRRSLVAAAALQEIGYTHLASVAGGFNRWKADTLPWEIPRALSRADRERYHRHLLIPEVGEEGQLKLLNSKVLIVGAGGLGSPIALYLAAAGIGQLGIIDNDLVDRSNLQRQILHSDHEVGKPKAESALRRLQALNPSIQVKALNLRLTAENVDAIVSDYDLVIDGTDNFNTRFLVNDACVKWGKPNVHGAIFRFEGQVSVFWPQSGADAPCYRCLFSEPTPNEFAPSCAEAGVLGVLPGLVGTLCAAEAIKCLLGIGTPLVGKILRIHLLENDFEVLSLSRNPDCSYCSQHESGVFPEYSFYPETCQS
jgi:sulfur-carrier protein adenylyltransferase/sulfurtransferase